MSKTALLLLLLITALPLAAQERKLQHKPFIDERAWHYGFFVGLHDQSLRLEGNGYIDPESGAQWLSTNDRQNFGLSVGIMGNWRLSRHLALRLAPGLHFGSKHLTFRNQADGRELTQDMKTAYVGLPFELKLSAPRFNNHRPYLIGGLAAHYDLTRTKGEMLRTRPLQLFAEVGLGCDFYLPFFKLNPELKFCFGLSDVLRHDRPDLTEASQRVFTRSIASATPGMVVLTFYFE